jgi:hypothetical protein
MSERAIAMVEVSQEKARTARTFPFHRAYVPVTTFLLVLLLGMWLVHEAEPLTAPPPELRKETGVNPALSPQEAKLARAVIEPGFASRGGREQLLFIGNSQTMAIPYAQPWDISTPQWFQVLLSRRDPGAVDVHRGSLGGLTMVETFVRVVSFGESTAGPAAVILAIHPELINRLSMRDEVRDEARQAAVSSQLRSLAESSPEFATSFELLNTLVKTDATNESTSGIRPWPARLENYLQSDAEAFRLFAQRDLFLDVANVTFRKYRNRVFHVTSASPRPLEDSAYRTNLHFLELTLKYMQAKGIRSVLYLGPLRPIQPNPDSARDLLRVRDDVSTIAQRHGAACLDYTKLVPETYWTDYEPTRMSQLTGDAGQHDFAHFRAAAHKLVAEKLLQDAGNLYLIPAH